MKHSFDFELAKPPVLNESMLRRELERRQERWKIILLIAAALIGVAAAIVTGLIQWQTAPWLAAVCIGYGLLTITGGTAAVLIWARKGGAAQ